MSDENPAKVWYLAFPLIAILLLAFALWYLPQWEVKRVEKLLSELDSQDIVEPESEIAEELCKKFLVYGEKIIPYLIKVMRAEKLVSYRRADNAALMLSCMIPRFGDKIIEPLKEMYKNKSTGSSTAARAFWALRSAKSLTVEEYVEALSDSRHAIKFHAVMKMSEMEQVAKEAVPGLEKYTYHSRTGPLDQKNAFQALTKVRETEFVIPALIRLLVRWWQFERNTSKQARQALLAYGKIHGMDLVESHLIAEFTKTRNPRIAEMLWEDIQTPAALEALKE